MLRPSMLPLSFLLRLSYSLIPPPPTLGSIVVNSTFSAAPKDSLGAVLHSSNPTPVCVDNVQHSTWGPTLGQFDYSKCRQALEIVTSKLDGDKYKSWDFYSKQVFPAGREGWPLAQGATAGESKNASLSP